MEEPSSHQIMMSGLLLTQDVSGACREVHPLAVGPDAVTLHLEQACSPARVCARMIPVLASEAGLVLADKSSPFQMVQALSSHLQEVPAEDVLLSLHHVPQVFILPCFWSCLWSCSRLAILLLTLHPHMQTRKNLTDLGWKARQPGNGQVQTGQNFSGCFCRMWLQVAEGRTKLHQSAGASGQVHHFLSSHPTL